jgi:TRAP-type transport system small permease protein
MEVGVASAPTLFASFGTNIPQGQPIVTPPPTGPDLGDPTIGMSDEIPVDLRDYGPEDWAAFALFWGLAFVVFLQFFTRYVLNDSLAWTEEIARYLLMAVAFVGGGMAVRRMSHIHVEFLFVYMPRRLARAISGAVDIVRIAFFGYATWLGWRITEIMEFQRMVVIDLPMSWVFGTCTLGLGVMTLRAVQVAVRHWRDGDSPLTRVSIEGRHQ